MARLTDVIGRDLRQMVVDARTLTVPAADEARFVAEFAVPLPAVGRADLHRWLGAAAAARRRHGWPSMWTFSLAIGWAWTGRAVYDVGEERRRFPLAARRGPQHPRPGRRAGADRRPGACRSDPPPTELDGLAAAQFVEQVLPELTARGVDGRPAGRRGRLPADRVGPGLAGHARAPDRFGADWFDLHLKVPVDGEEVPFEDLFVALTRGEEFMILETGVYFGLDRPEFVRLRELIEEAKALDRPPAGAEVNRFQASLWEDLVSLGAEIDQSARWTADGTGLLADAASVEPAPACRRRCGPSCGRISSTGTAGCTTSGATTSAGSWPTTWGWARRCRPWP